MHYELGILLKKKVILLGASTGGPSQIKEMLSAIKILTCSIVVVQHMQENILPFFIKDLQENLPHRVDSTPVESLFEEPSIIICSSSSILKKTAHKYNMIANSAGQIYTPDINKLFKSFVPYINDFEIQIIIMTGIGDDGVAGAVELKKLGAKIIVEHEKSCPVYGMPRVAVEKKIVDEVKTIEELVEYFKELKWDS